MSEPEKIGATVREIVKQSLDSHGYDGLCRKGCGCGKGDLFPCGGADVGDCKPAYRHIGACEGCELRQGCDYDDPEDEGKDWGRVCYQERKPNLREPSKEKPCCDCEWDRECSLHIRGRICNRMYKPKTKVEDVCPYCDGTGDIFMGSRPNNKPPCTFCKGTGRWERDIT